MGNMNDPDTYDSDSYSRGAVVWADDLLKDRGEYHENALLTRPWMIISNIKQPFDDEWISIPITSKCRRDAIPILPENWVRGELQKMSYVNPWITMTIKKRHIHSYVGSVTQDFVNNAVDEMNKYICSNESLYK